MEQARALMFSLAHKISWDTVGKWDYSLAYALLMDPEYGVVENFMPHTAHHASHMLKASSKSDPDTPNLSEALRRPCREEFMEAMQVEIEALEKHSTWKLVRR